MKKIERYRNLFVNREDAMGGSLNVEDEKDKGQGDQSQPHIGEAAKMGATPPRFGEGCRSLVSAIEVTPSSLGPTPLVPEDTP